MNTCNPKVYPDNKQRRQEVQTEYGNFLNTMDWHYYLTLTTRYPLSLPSARRSAERFYNRIEREHGGSRLFFVAEPFDTKHSYHLHGLIYLENRDVKINGLNTIRDAWRIVSKGGKGKVNNFTIVKRYKKDLGANFYIGKYLTRNNADYDLLFNSDFPSNSSTLLQ